MAANEGKHPGINRQRLSDPAGDDSPTEALTSALTTAEAAFAVRRDGDPGVMVAFSLGWQMAEVYRPDRRRVSMPAAQDDLPGVSRLNAAELQEMGLFQIEAGITKLRASICDAGLVSCGLS